MKLEYVVTILLALAVVMMLIGAVYGQPCTVVGPGEQKWLQSFEARPFNQVKKACYKERALSCLLEKGARMRSKGQRGEIEVYVRQHFEAHISIREWEDFDMDFREECLIRAGTRR